MGGQLLLQPDLLIAPALQVVLQQPPIADQHHRKSGFLGGDSELGGGGGLLLRPGQDGELAVGLQQSKLDGADVGVALHPQLLQQLVNGQAAPLQLPLEHLPVLHHHRRLAAQQGPEAQGLGAQRRNRRRQGQQHHDGDQPGQQGNPVVLHGDGGQIRDDQRQHQLGGLQLPDLVLAQQPDAHNNEQVKHHGAYEYHKHKNTSFPRMPLARNLYSQPPTPSRCQCRFSVCPRLGAAMPPFVQIHKFCPFRQKAPNLCLVFWGEIRYNIWGQEAGGMPFVSKIFRGSVKRGIFYALYTPAV